MVAYIPGKYVGKSTWRKTRLAKIPPIPPKETIIAVDTALFVWETILFEDYDQQIPLIRMHCVP